MSRYTDRVDASLKGLEFVSTGFCPGCGECPDFTEEERDAGACDEGGFSWSSCDGCRSTFGGTRYVAHGCFPVKEGDPLSGKIVHFEVCTDCLVYLANGEEPEDWKQCPGEDEKGDESC